MNSLPTPILGVAIVTYASSDVIVGCLDSLLASEDVDLRIALCDNASPDDTVDVIRDWAVQRGLNLAEIAPEEAASGTTASLTLIRLPLNLGFAGGTNAALRHLVADPEIDLAWVLNPDCEVEPSAAKAFAARASRTGEFALMSGRVLFHAGDGIVHSDGGRVNMATGFCHNINRALPVAEADKKPTRRRDFFTGANMIASRAFIETCGLMREDYFLYYEEVDWALRRGDLPLVWCEEAVVRHHVGTSIGTAQANRAASAFSNYFNFRNRMIFLWRFNPVALPFAYLYSAAKVTQILFRDGREAAAAALRGLLFLSPPHKVEAKVAPASRPLAFRCAESTGRNAMVGRYSEESREMGAEPKDTGQEWRH